MNPCIQELEKQCYGHASLHDDTIVFDKEKFAELIVRECASVIEKNHPEFSCKEAADNLYRKAGRMDAIDEILQHFGVEQ